MRDEVLDKALQSDPKVIPRYNLVRPDGTLVAENLELVLVNPVLTPGMPFDNLHVLSDETATMLGMDPGPATPDDAFQMLAALASSGGGSGDTGELEDFEFETGLFANAGAGWNTKTFDRPFEKPPQVFATVKVGDMHVFIQNVTEAGFQYCLKLSSGTTTATEAAISYLAVYFGGDRKC